MLIFLATERGHKFGQGTVRTETKVSETRTSSTLNVIPSQIKVSELKASH